MRAHRRRRAFAAQAAAAMVFAALAACAPRNGSQAPQGAATTAPASPAAASSADPSAAIAGLGFDQRSGGLDRIVLSLARANPAAADPAGFDFAVVVDARGAGFWTARPAAAPAPDSDHVLLELQPASGATLPPLGARIVVKAVDRNSGDESVLAGAVVAKRVGAFVDPSLAQFVTLPRVGLVPAGWGPSGNAVAGGRVSKISQDGVTGTTLSLSAPHRDWNAFGLAQSVPLRDASAFSVRVRPTHDCDGDAAAPTLVSGVALSDAVGHLAQFCISSKIRSPHVSQFSDGRQLIAVVPGRLNAWNLLRVDMDAMRSIFRLYPAKTGIVVTLGISLHRSASAPANDRISFADITVP